MADRQEDFGAGQFLISIIAHKTLTYTLYSIPIYPEVVKTGIGSRLKVLGY